MNSRLDIGHVIDGVFKIYRDHAAVLLPAAAAVFLIEAVLGALLVAVSPILVLVALVVQIVATTFFQGMVVALVNDVQDGRRDFSVGELLRAVTGAVVPLIAAGLLAGLGIALGFILLIIPGLFLLTIWAVISPVIVLERPGVIAAFGRSRELVRGHGWQVLAVIVLFFLILVVVSAVLGAIGGAAGTAGRLIADFVASVLTAPLVALASAVLYFNLRGLKGEGAPTGEAASLQPGGSAQAPTQPTVPESQPRPGSAPPA